MQMMGFDTKLMVSNAGPALWTIYVYLALIVVFAFTFKIRCCRRRLGKYLFWNALVRLLTEVYLEMLMLAALNLHTVEWDNPFSFVKYSNAMAVFGILTLVIAPIMLTFILCKKRLEWSTESFTERHGALLKGNRIRSKAISKEAVIFYVISYFMRRMVFVSAFFIFEQHVWPQIVFLMLISMVMMII